MRWSPCTPRSRPLRTVDAEGNEPITGRRDHAGPDDAVGDPAAQPRGALRADQPLLTKKEITDVIDMVYRHCGQKETVIFADRMMALGFGYACKAGISFGKDDLIVPDSKEKLVETKDQVKEFEQQYLDGLITQGEKYNKVVDLVPAPTCRADEMMKVMSDTDDSDDADQLGLHDGPLRRPWLAGQIKQLAGMRGLMAKPSGEIIETPIISNFKEGLTVLEYFNSTHGARKGLADTALKTANSGYLTRRLVDVAQDASSSRSTAAPRNGLTVPIAVIEGGEVIAPLSERILGRYRLGRRGRSRCRRQDRQGRRGSSRKKVERSSGPGIESRCASVPC